jgi:hypothetical protein
MGVASAGASQASPQAPQFSASRLTSTHLPAQTRSALAHERLQRPPEQTCPAGHAAPQAPQFAGSLATFRQRPPQLAKPEAQRMPH